jgi:hypothetical protein
MSILNSNYWKNHRLKSQFIFKYQWTNDNNQIWKNKKKHAPYKAMYSYFQFLITYSNTTRIFPYNIGEPKVCVIWNKTLVNIQYLDMWRNHYTCEVTTEKCYMYALRISTETIQTQFSLISGTAAFICWCYVRIKIIYTNRCFYCLIKSLFVVRMRIIRSLGLRPRDKIPWIRTSNSDLTEW